jgi:hypothetical protein
MADRRLLAALSLSLLIHLTLVGAPGWRLPQEHDEPDMSATLQAHIAPTRPDVAPVATAVPRRPKRQPSAPPKDPPAAARDAAAMALPSAPPVVAEAEPEPAPEPVPVAPPQAPPAAVAAQAVEILLPRQGRIRFLVTRGEGEQTMQIGQTTHTWRHDGSSYALQTLTETTGLVGFFRPVKVVQVSEGEVGTEGLVPREFRVERNGQAAEGARFDWDTRRVALSEGGRVRRELAVAVGAQDLLSQLHQLGVSRKAARVEMMIATGKNYGRYVFDLVGEELLQTRFGALRALHYRTPAMPGEQASELWLACEQHNLPLKIRHIDRKGEIFEQTAVELEIDGARFPGSE